MSELIICNNKTICIQKTLTFGSRMENSHRNINTMFHATSTAEHKETITATATAVYVKIIFYFFMISLIVMLNCFFNLSTKLSRDVNSFVPNI